MKLHKIAALAAALQHNGSPPALPCDSVRLA